MSFPTTLSRFYITFATITEYENGDPNIKMNIKMATRVSNKVEIVLQMISFTL